MIKKIYCVLLCLVIVCVFFNGCSYDHELKNMEIMTALGIDKNDENIILCAQVLKADKAINDSYEESYRYFFGEGREFEEAFEQIEMQCSEELAFSHNKLYLIGTNVIEDRKLLKEVLFNEKYDIRPNGYIVAIENDMKDIIMSNDEYGFDCCYKLLDMLKEISYLPDIGQFIYGFCDENKPVWVPVIELQNNQLNISDWICSK